MLGDTMIVSLLKDGRLRADTVAGLVFAPRSNTPEKPVGAMTRKGYLRVCINVRGRQHHFFANVGRRDSVRDGKGRFGRLLDGQTHDAMPRSQA